MRCQTKVNVEKGKFTYVGSNNLKYTFTLNHGHEKSALAHQEKWMQIVLCKMSA